MKNLDVILPLLLLLLAFFLKLLVDQAANLPLVVQAAYALPVDIVFLATSFAAAFTISSPQNAGRGLLHVITYILAAVVVVLLWRRCGHLFDRTHYAWSAVLFVLNTGLSAAILVTSVGLLSEVHR